MSTNHHTWTAGLLLLFAVSILLGAIFFTTAYVRILNTSDYINGSQPLTNAKNALLWAFILGYIAAGIAIVLAILYFGHVTWGINSEMPHLFLFILLGLLIIGSMIAAFIAWNDARNTEVTDNGGSVGYIIAGIVALAVGLIVLIISGAWRAQRRASEASVLPPAPTESEVTITSPTTMTSVATTSAPVAIPPAPMNQAPQVAFPYSV